MLKGRDYEIISIVINNVLDKICRLFRLKILKTTEIKETCLNIIKATYDMATANIMIRGEKFEAFPLMSAAKLHSLHSLQSLSSRIQYSA